MTTRASLNKNGVFYTLVQVGQMVEIRDRVGARTGEEFYLPNGWVGMSDDLRRWLISLGYGGM